MTYVQTRDRALGEKWCKCGQVRPDYAGQVSGIVQVPDPIGLFMKRDPVFPVPEVARAGKIPVDHKAVVSHASEFTALYRSVRGAVISSERHVRGTGSVS